MASDKAFLLSVDSKHVLTFNQLHSWTEQIASGLRRIGVGPGDVVIADLPNSPAFVVTLRAAWSVGAVFAPLNPLLTPREKAAIVELAGPAVVVGTNTSSVVESLVRWSDPFGQPPEVCSDARLAAASVVAEQDRLILFTSGSTGTPKAVALTEDNVAAGIAAVADRFALSEHDHTVAMLPWSHGHGLFATLLAPLTTAGRVTVAIPGHTMQPHDLVAAAHPTWITVVPPLLALLTAGVEHSGAQISGMRFIRTASAPLPHPLAQRAEQLLGAPVAEALGLTETSHQAAANPPTSQRVLGTVGTPTGIQFRLSGQEILGGRELEARGPALFRCYLGNAAATADAMTPDGWFRTRDVAEFDDAGRIRIIGRLSEIVNRGGFKVSPAEVEAVLGAHPDVVASLVTGIAHQTLGQELAAVVILRDGAPTLKRDIVRHCRDNLADYKVPGRIHLVDRLPQLPNGKPSRRLAAQLFETGTP